MQPILIHSQNANPHTSMHGLSHINDIRNMWYKEDISQWSIGDLFSFHGHNGAPVWRKITDIRLVTEKELLDFKNQNPVGKEFNFNECKYVFSCRFATEKEIKTVLAKHTLLTMRKKRNYTQSQVAELMETSTPSYAQYERGERKPGIEWLMSYCVGLQCHLVGDPKGEWWVCDEVVL